MRRHGDNDTLSVAIDLFDLSKYLHDRYPDSGVLVGRPGSYLASWRGNTNSNALSLSKQKGTGRWLWQDFGTGEGGNAFTFLATIEAMPPQEAAHYLIEKAGLGTQDATRATESDSSDRQAPKYHPLPSEAVQRLTELPLGLVKVMKGRGFTKQLIERYGIRADGKDALIPITSPEGVVLQVKRRVGTTEEPGKKYRYEHKDYGSPAWCSTNSREAPMLLIVEGELSAIIAHAALQDAGEDGIGVMGVAGASNALYPGLCRNKRVLIYADADPAGEKARQSWAKAAHEQGAISVSLMPAQEPDFCEFAGKFAEEYGLRPLAELLDGLRAASVQVYGATDRMLGNVTVRELIERNSRYLRGETGNPTGFRAFDDQTGGIRESGIYAIGGLSSMGKSSAMRYMLLNHVRQGGKVKLYSPDQAPGPFYRLVAALLSGVSAGDVRRYNKGDSTAIAPESIKLWGSPDEAAKAHEETFGHVASEIAPNLLVSEESRPRKIIEDMKRSVDDGVTMFGLDYVQMMREGYDDGEQMGDLMAVSQALGVPILAAMQLAKYKYPDSRVSGLPVMSDIEGSGAYFQNTEMVMLIYNEEIYRHKYAGDKWQPTDDLVDEGRLILVKDKEGRTPLTFHMAWRAHLAAYTNSGPFDLKYERRGLM